jgi:peptidoglycan/xylan/chitin deacetylase (PgdA/CDA1 family)
LTLCYPFGSFGKETMRIASELGYKVAVSLDKGHVSPSSDRLALPRIVVAYSDGLPALLYKLRIRPKLRLIGI